MSAPVRNLRQSPGPHHVELGGRLVVRTEPRLTRQRERFVGVVGHEELGPAARQLLERVPHPRVVSGARKVVSRLPARRSALRVE